MFNSRVAIAVRNDKVDAEDTSRIVTPHSQQSAPKSKSKRKSISINTVGNPGIKLSENHPANIIEGRRKYAAREYLDKVSESGYPVSPLAVSALGLSQAEDGTWNTNGTPDERLYGQNLTKYLDTKLVPNTADSGKSSPITRIKERAQRLLNNGYSSRDHVTFGTLIRNPHFKVAIPNSEDNTKNERVPVGRDQVSGRIVNPLGELTSHHFAGQKNLLDTINGVENSAFPKEEGATPKISNVTGAINRGLRSHFKKFNKSLFVSPEGDKTYFFGKFTTLANNIQQNFKPYDRIEVQPPTQEQLFKAKGLIRQQRPEFFNDKGDFVNSEAASRINDHINRFIIDKNNQSQLDSHTSEYNGLTRALKNISVCPCPHCQISNYNNPLATVLDSSLHREVKGSNDPILKNVFKKHFGFYNPHALMVNDPETVYTREDGGKGGGYPHSLSTNIVRQVLHKRLKLRS